MMHRSDARLAKILMNRKLEEAGRLARSRHLAYPVDTSCPGWQHQLLGHLGARLVALGERLVQLDPVRPYL